MAAADLNALALAQQWSDEFYTDDEVWEPHECSDATFNDEKFVEKLALKISALTTAATLPSEPTSEMIDAGREKIGEYFGEDSARRMVSDIYRAMVSTTPPTATPSPEAHSK